MTSPSRLTMTVEQLRSAFDGVYAAPAASLASERVEDLLAIRLAGDAYAIRIGQITGLVSDRKVVAVPSAMPELLGVAGTRAGLVPVYSLAALVGHASDASRSRWLALCGAEEPIGLAFSDFEGYIRIPSAQVYAAGHSHLTREHVKDAVRTADVVRAIVNIPSIVETIKRRCGESRVSKER